MIELLEEQWSEWFTYDESSPSFLVNAKDRHTAKKGNTSGHLDRKGYWRVSLYNKETLTHRVIYEMFHSKIPDGMVIDHIDGDIKNNNISNLRCITRALNSRNKRRAKGINADITGVYHEVQVKPNGSVVEYWQASWVKDRKCKSKRFSIAKFGFDTAKKMAIEYRAKMIELLNLEGYGYTERHYRE